MRNKLSYKCYCYAYLLLFYVATLIFLDYEKFTYKYPNYLDGLKTKLDTPGTLSKMSLFAIYSKNAARNILRLRIKNPKTLFIDKIALNILTRHLGFLDSCFYNCDTRFHLILCLRYYFISKITKTKHNFFEIEEGLIEYYNIPPDKRNDVDYLYKKFYSIFKRECHITGKESSVMFFQKILSLFELPMLCRRELKPIIRVENRIPSDLNLSTILIFSGIPNDYEV